VECECKDVGCFLILELSTSEWGAILAERSAYVIVLEHAPRYPRERVELREAYAVVRTG
jgi:hypothetical protein